ncbi:MAG TPA: hypothetical protein VFE42_17400 [Chloroflexota bacterium]|nr:hypothetical protein [Chloroflexota bacterium]
MARPKAQDGRQEPRTIAVNPKLVRQGRKGAAATSDSPPPLLRHWLDDSISRTRTGAGSLNGVPEIKNSRWHIYDLPAGLALDLEDLTPDGFIAAVETIALPLGQRPASDAFDERMKHRRLQQAVDAAGQVALRRNRAWSAADIERAHYIADGYGGFSYVLYVQDGRTVVAASAPQTSITGGDGRWPSQYPGVEHWLCLPSPSGTEVYRVHVDEPERR